MPGAVIGAQRGLVTFGVSVEFALPCRIGGRSGVRFELVDRLSPDPCHRAHIGQSALPSLDLECRDSCGLQHRQKLQRVQAGGFFQGMKNLAADLVSALAYRRVTGGFVCLIAVDQDIVQVNAAHAAGLFIPTHEFGR